jgi:hypothetical protein
MTHTPNVPNAPGQSPNTLPAGTDTTSDYPTRCPDCTRPTHWLAVFPGSRCVDCHAAVAVPITDARQLARMWGATS